MDSLIENLESGIRAGNFRALSRAISLVENEHLAQAALLETLQPDASIPVIGITGPPGAGKSTLINELIRDLTEKGNRIAVLSIDPSSVYHSGAILGDRIRMRSGMARGDVFIRSMASRGALGGLSEKAFEAVDVLRSSRFNYIFVETVGVGQSETDISSLADKIWVLLVPEGGDGVQQIKSGIMEVGDAYIINKADRPGARSFASSLQNTFALSGIKKPIYRLSAIEGTGIAQLISDLESSSFPFRSSLERQVRKALVLIQRKRIRQIDKQLLTARIETALEKGFLNLYQLVDQYY